MTAEAMMFHGVERWITSDGVRSYVGPVRHRVRRTSLFRRRRKETTVPIEETPTAQMPKVEPARPQTLADLGNAITQMIVPVLGQLPPQPPRSRWRRVLDKLTDPDWHSTARQCAGTALMWGFTTTVFVIFGKAMLWVLFL